MDRTNGTKKLDYDYCKAAPALELFANKWNLVVLHRLHEGGFISRTVYPEAPPRVVYDLARLGRSLYPLAEQLMLWGIEHHDDIMKHRNS